MTTPITVSSKNEVQTFYAKLQQVLSCPDKIAYAEREDQHTYLELRNNTLLFASTFSNCNQRRIVTSASKCFDTYSLIIAILQTNNIWIPLSTETPEARIKEVLEVSSADFFIIENEISEDLYNFCKKNNIQLLTLESAKKKTHALIQDLGGQQPEQLSMIYFTSGSSGVPKGVKIKHESFVRNVNNIIDLVVFPKKAIVADIHDFSFVISVPVIFPCLLLQGCLVPLNLTRDKLKLATFIQKNEINVLITVPSTLDIIHKEGFQKVDKKQLFTIVMCGEPLYLNVLSLIFENFSTKHVYNFYGSTEVAPWIFYHHCKREDLVKFSSFGCMPIGQPIAGNEIRVLNDELFVSGVQVTPGYLNFVDEEKFEKIDGKIWFRTGDRVELNDSSYLCKGRTDNVLKIYGNRIDLGEVEARLRLIDGIHNVVCFANDVKSPRFVCAYIQVAPTKIFNESDVREKLSLKLPLYMIPRKFIFSESPPLNRSGKIDRHRIKEMYQSR